MWFDCKFCYLPETLMFTACRNEPLNLYWYPCYDGRTDIQSNSLTKFFGGKVSSEIMKQAFPPSPHITLIQNKRLNHAVKNVQHNLQPNSAHCSIVLKLRASD